MLFNGSPMCTVTYRTANPSLLELQSTILHCKLHCVSTFKILDYATEQYLSASPIRHVFPIVVSVVWFQDGDRRGSPEHSTWYFGSGTLTAQGAE